MEKRWVATIHLDTLKVEYDPTFKFKCVENCGKCCYELEIPIRDEDIAQIEELGYNAWEFVDYEKMFYRGDKFLSYALKKRPFDGGCVFLNPGTLKCKIYNHRPLACRLYPFVFVKHGNKMEVYVKKDSFCPGINHPDGEPVTKEFLLREYGDVIEDYRRKVVNTGE
ncbi:YkgJ family cysteine cluster protein [Thermococcus sp. GR7]|uniref:YkgJ family cysteine cluster protein n=1 Tax=unclassified Thermococcus TaxID=2627626 RepID=UPI0014318392|nr:MULTISPECIES: YkgJ family cysteine cluster protein [unclassified Thermococcus]NJE47058.1 YkgJ family cysteine cluster protein [Thermococcus sp. GR7]NJE78117.1 YkgJ family cysteine cluster protein [Thermococcus sp. GR4]NJF22766.1 YkgJ family cysteine cluster protein [Thermococcus sp. GR5]